MKLNNMISLALFGVVMITVLQEVEFVNAQGCVPQYLDPKSFIECGSRGFVMRCNSTGMTEVPSKYPLVNSTYTQPLCLLDLSNNSISHIWNQSFVSKKNIDPSKVRWLYLHNNSLTHISADAFHGLTNLVYLNLSRNMLQVNSFEHNAFKHLVSLLDINFKVNNFTTFEGLDKELVYLNKLKGLYINPLTENCVFGPQFQYLRSLITVGLSGMDNSCNFEVVGNETFQYVRQAQYLFLNMCNVTRIEANALSHFQNLTDLDISYNEKLNFNGMNQALYGLINSTTLKTLNVNKIHSLYELGVMLKASDLDNLSTLRALETLYMDLNKIEVLDPEILSPKVMFPASLQNFTLSGNRLTYGKYVSYVDCAWNISFIDISRQHVRYDPFYPHDSPFSDSTTYHGYTKYLKRPNQNIVSTTQNEVMDACYCNNTDSDNIIHLPRNLRKLKWHKSFLQFEIPCVYFKNGSHLTYLDLSFNLLTEWRGPIHGLTNLKHLDLSENYCHTVSNCFFQGFPNLEHLNMSGNNQIGNSFDPRYNQNARTMFSNQKKITKLDLSFCGIEQLPEDIIQNMTALKELRVNKNAITDWNQDLSQCMCLRHLDISDNMFKSLPKTFTSYLDKLVTSPCNNGTNVTLLLGGNPFDCSCDSFEFFEWLVATKVFVQFKHTDTCNRDGHSQSMTSKDDFRKLITDIQNDPLCKKTPQWVTVVLVVVSALAGGVVSSFIGILVYRNRWKLRYMYYSKNRRYVHEGYDHLFAKDAVISYAKGNASFIKDVVVPVLEREHGLSLWVVDRDQQAGASIAENITYAIYNSRKMVLLIDKEYLQNSWCNYDMNMALVETVESKRQLIIVVLMERQSTDTLPINVLRLLQKERSLEYPEFGEDMGAFWTNLASEIRA